MSAAHPRPTGDVLPRRGRPSGGDAVETRQRLIDGARRCFALQGYSGASIRKIAADSGLATMSIYNYATSKVSLYEMVWRQVIEDTYVAYAAVVEGKATTLEEVDALLERTRGLVRDDPVNAAFGTRLMLDRHHPELAHIDLHQEAPEALFNEMADRAVERGTLDRAETAQFVTFMITLLLGVMTAVSSDVGSVDLIVDAAKWAAHRFIEPDRD